MNAEEIRELMSNSDKWMNFVNPEIEERRPTPRPYVCPDCGAHTTEAWTGQGWHTAPHDNPTTGHICE